MPLHFLLPWHIRIIVTMVLKVIFLYDLVFTSYCDHGNKGILQFLLPWYIKIIVTMELKVIFLYDLVFKSYCEHGIKGQCPCNFCCLCILK